MPYSIREMQRTDVPLLEKLLADYMRETYEREWEGSSEKLERDALGGLLKIIVAENESEIVGFIAWITTYDLHHCLKGGEVIDFYVKPKARGYGVGLLMLAYLAAEIQKHDGKFLKGGAVENPSVRRFYSRIAMIFPNGDCYVSGRAFRHLAGLSGKSVREIVRNLPETTWNYDA